MKDEKKWQEPRNMEEAYRYYRDAYDSNMKQAISDSELIEPLMRLSFFIGAQSFIRGCTTKDSANFVHDMHLFRTAIIKHITEAKK